MSSCKLEEAYVSKKVKVKVYIDHMIVINSGFLPGTTILWRLIFKINVEREKIKSVNACA